MTLTNLSRAETSTVYLVRHAEKAADSMDPPLTDAGQRRAKELAKLLSNSNVVGIYTSRAKRAVDTAIPLAAQINLQATILTQDSVHEIADKLRRTPVNASSLLVWHVDELPLIVESLGGDTPAYAESEYDRLLEVRLENGKFKDLKTLRYGE